MTPPPHVCELCGYRTDPTGETADQWLYQCPNCTTMGTENR